MRRCVCVATLAAVVLGLTGSATAVTYYAGLRWDDGTSQEEAKVIPPGGTATLEMFATTADSASTNEFLFYLSASTGPADGLSAVSTEPLTGWTYEDSFGLRFDLSVNSRG